MLERSVDMRGQIKFIDIEELMPQDHLLRKIDAVLDWEQIYDLVEHLYCEDNGRPSADPVVLVKMVLLQHLYGIASLRRTVAEIDMNIAYRWFLHYDLDTPIPHFATLSYAFASRFPSEIFEEIFAWILEEAVSRGLVKAQTVFVDATHVKANANRKKYRKVLAQKTARIYDEQLREEINADREAHSKKPFDDDDAPPPSREVKESISDPESGLFVKGEHKVEFAYGVHVVCDEHNFVLASEVTPGNVHDSTVFDTIYDETVENFPEVEVVVADAGYKTPWIAKKVFDSGRIPSLPYRRPMTKDFGHKWWEYVYDEHNDWIICPEYKELPYVTTNRDGYREYKSYGLICEKCPTREQCTRSRNCRKTVTRHIWQGYLERAEDVRHSPLGRATYGLRSQKIERVFADAKEKYGMRYTLHRGLDRVTNWVRLKFAAMNLKKLALWA